MVDDVGDENWLAIFWSEVDNGQTANLDVFFERHGSFGGVKCVWIVSSLNYMQCGKQG